MGITPSMHSQYCKWLKSLPYALSNRADYVSTSFVDPIMEIDIPLGWKSLNLERYDGTIDPDKHLDAFQTQANLYTNNDVILCCVFPSSLKGATLTWHGGLPPRSINNFDTLIERFSV